jgi:hypothetical protein
LIVMRILSNLNTGASAHAGIVLAVRRRQLTPFYAAFYDGAGGPWTKDCGPGVPSQNGRVC